MIESRSEHSIVSDLLDDIRLQRKEQQGREHDRITLRLSKEMVNWVQMILEERLMQIEDCIEGKNSTVS